MLSTIARTGALHVYVMFSSVIGVAWLAADLFGPHTPRRPR